MYMTGMDDVNGIRQPILISLAIQAFDCISARKNVVHKSSTGWKYDSGGSESLSMFFNVFPFDESYCISAADSDSDGLTLFV